jgi:two-component system, cell cycle sensor histidine kinase and response regulator CckA
MRRSIKQSRPEPDDHDAILPDHSEDEIRRLIEAAPLAAFAAGGDSSLTVVNQHLCDILGYEPNELNGHKFEKLIALPKPGYEKVHLSDLPPRGDVELARADGIAIPAELFRRRLPDGGALVFVVDLTGRKLAEQEHLESEQKRWQSDRIEALGRLAGGVAHDFNNFLAVLLLHVDILNLNLEPDSPIRGRVAEIKEVANSIANTVRQLFAFGRKQPMTLAPAKLNPVVEQFANEFRAAAAGIDVELNLDADLGVCFVDQAQVVQILRNLAVNAKEAMPNGGTLKIETSNIKLDPAATVQPSGPYVQIAVSDTGVGMEPSTEAHIFEPFFSTKESDKGAGLALAMVYGIVKQSKGFIWVDSEVGKGTTFRVQFPRIDLVQPATPSEAAKADPSEQKTVLLVDDEAAVRRITAEFLEMSGYKVLHAGSGMEALEVAQAYFAPIDLLLTDLSMPLMDGREVAGRITKLHPETAVLFMSGNINEASEGAEDRPDFIGKPFSLTGLTEKVQALLKSQRV